jgi:hypothetical protein
MMMILIGMTMGRRIIVKLILLMTLSLSAINSTIRSKIRRTHHHSLTITHPPQKYLKIYTSNMNSILSYYKIKLRFHSPHLFELPTLTYPNTRRPPFWEEELLKYKMEAPSMSN